MKLRSARIDAARAARIAAQREGGRMDEMEIDATDDGTAIWQVDLIRDVGSQVEVSLDARTGEPVAGED